MLAAICFHRSGGFFSRGGLLGGALRDLLGAGRQLLAAGGDVVGGSERIGDDAAQAFDHLLESNAERILVRERLRRNRQIAVRDLVGDVSCRTQVRHHALHREAESVLLRKGLRINREVTHRDLVGECRRIAKIRGHDIDGFDQILDFVVRLDLDILFEVADGDGIGGSSNLVETTADPDRNPQSCDDGTEKGRNRQADDEVARLEIERVGVDIRLRHLTPVGLDAGVHRLCDLVGHRAAIAGHETDGFGTVTRSNQRAHLVVQGEIVIGGQLEIRPVLLAFGGRRVGLKPSQRVGKRLAVAITRLDICGNIRLRGGRRHIHLRLDDAQLDEPERLCFLQSCRRSGNDVARGIIKVAQAHDAISCATDEKNNHKAECNGQFQFDGETHLKISPWITCYFRNNRRHRCEKGTSWFA